MSKALRPRTRGRVRPSASLAASFVLALVSAACTAAGGHQPLPIVGLPPDWTGQIAWTLPTQTGHLRSLARWREAVGVPVARPEPARPAISAGAITVVSWNVANGLGDVPGLIETLGTSRPLVLLLQEAYRRGPAVPSRLSASASFAGRLGGLRVSGDDTDVEALAARLGLSLFYVPSMRNGDATSDEDRGNAILSNLPMTQLQAIELPFERQRRVAVAATIAGIGDSGAPWRLRVVSAHLDNLSSARTLWLGGEYGRARQARAIRDALAGDDAVVLGGDFNTWFAFSEAAFVETFDAFPDTLLTDRRATFAGLLRLDHLFFRLQDGWHASFRRGENRHGSDHHPLVGLVHLPS